MKIRYIVIIAITILFFPYNVKADNMSNYALNKLLIGSRDNVAYEITDLKLENGYLIIKGWSFANLIQNHNSINTHKYMLELIDQKTNQTIVYFSNPYNIDKTNLVKMGTLDRKCKDWEFYSSGTYCYSDLSWSGFEFYIPLSNLNSNTEYNINFAINLNLVGETHYFYNGIVIPGFENLELIENGRKYYLSGQFETWEFKVTTGYVINRLNPGKSGTSQKNSPSKCTSWNTTLYWNKNGVYTNYLGSRWIGAGLEKELWINLAYNPNNIVCQYEDNGVNLQTITNGTGGNGWITTAFLNYYGKPSTLKINNLESTKINSVETYTAKKNSNSKVIVNLNNSINQQVNLKIRYNNNYIYENNYTFIGNKDITIDNLKIGDNGKVEVIVTENNGITHNIQASIFVSSEQEIVLSNINNKIKIATPIVVLKKINEEEKYYYETLDITIPHNYINVVAGQSFNVKLDLLYSSDIDNIVLNNINGKVLFDSQDSNLNYPIIDNLVEIDLENDIKQINHISLKIPITYIDNLTGKTYRQNFDNLNLINGGNKWYIDLNKELGEYNYEYQIKDVGVNLVNIKIKAKYNVINHLLGINGLYKIKRVWTPINLNYIYKKTYTYFELLNKVGVN